MTGLSAEVAHVTVPGALFDLAVYVTDAPTGFRLDLVADPGVVDERYLPDLVDQYVALAERLCAAPDLPVLIFSGFPESQYATTVLRQGACGYLPKDCEPEEIVTAIRSAALGRRYITPQVAELLAEGLGRPAETAAPHESLSDRELQVFLRLAQGETIGHMADQMALSVKTVSTYRTRIMEKMKLESNSDLTYYAPWGNFAIFYKDFRYSAGLIRLGRFDAGMEAIGRAGPIRATIERIDG